MVRATAVITVLWIASGALAADRFEPESCFPKDCFFYASFNAGALRKGFAGSPFGKVVTHPGVVRALGRLPAQVLAKLEESSREFQEATGKSVLECIDLFTGEAAITISGIDIMAGPHLAFSVELGAKRKDILEVVARLEKLAAEEMGRFGEAPSPQKAEVKGIEVTSWTIRHSPSVQYGAFGGHFVFVMGGGMEALIDRFKASGDESRDALRFNPAFARSKLGTSGFTSALTLFYNWEGTRTMMDRMMGEIPMADEMKRAFAAVGLDKLSSATYKLGFRDGDFESKLYLDSPGGMSGILGLVSESVAPLEDPSVLGKLPSGALEVTGLSISVGRLVRGTLEKLREGFESSKGSIDAVVSGFESATGISVAEDLYKLPKISLALVSVLPPGGGVMPDQVLVVRTSQFEPYLVVLSKLLKQVGADVQPLRIEGKDVAFVSIGDLYSRFGIKDLFRAALAQNSPIPFLEPALNLAFAAIDDDWTVMTTSPQAMARYFAHYSKGEKASEDGGLTALIKKDAGSDAGFVAYRGGSNFVSIYNTLVGVAMQVSPYFEKEQKSYGIDLTQLPPGETFAADFRDGFLVVRPGKESFLIHAHGVLSNALFSPSLLGNALVCVTALGLKKAGLEGASPAGPGDRMKELGKLLSEYASASGGGAYPHASEGTLKAFQTMLDEEQVEDAERFVGLLVRPGGAEKVAKVDPGTDAYALTPENVSYELVPWKQGPKDNPGRILLYEKASREGKRQVLFVDLSIKSLGDDEFAALLDEQTKKYVRK